MARVEERLGVVIREPGEEVDGGLVESGEGDALDSMPALCGEWGVDLLRETQSSATLASGAHGVEAGRTLALGPPRGTYRMKDFSARASIPRGTRGTKPEISFIR